MKANSTREPQTCKILTCSTFSIQVSLPIHVSFLHTSVHLFLTLPVWCLCILYRAIGSSHTGWSSHWSDNNGCTAVKSVSAQSVEKLGCPDLAPCTSVCTWSIRGLPCLQKWGGSGRLCCPTSDGPAVSHLWLLLFHLAHKALCLLLCRYERVNEKVAEVEKEYSDVRSCVQYVLVVSCNFHSIYTSNFFCSLL